MNLITPQQNSYIENNVNFKASSGGKSFSFDFDKGDFNIVDGKEEHYIDKGVHIYQFKLNEDAYNLLNYSLKKYKKISNFS